LEFGARAGEIHHGRHAAPEFELLNCFGAEDTDFEIAPGERAHHSPAWHFLWRKWQKLQEYLHDANRIAIKYL
jgi:hypothetical protein